MVVMGRLPQAIAPFIRMVRGGGTKLFVSIPSLVSFPSLCVVDMGTEEDTYELFKRGHEKTLIAEYNHVVAAWKQVGAIKGMRRMVGWREGGKEGKRERGKEGKRERGKEGKRGRWGDLYRVIG